MKSSHHKQYALSGIKFWPKDDRPREKLFREGEHKLSDTELLAILLRSGVKGESAIDLARRIIHKFKHFRNFSSVQVKDLQQVKGLGLAKIAQIKAAVEIGRRFGEEKIKESKPQVKSSKDVADIFFPRMRDLKKEVFKLLILNSQNRIIENIEIVEGTVNKAYPIIREIFQKALQYFAVSIICVHNHPSGSPRPSKEDKEFTKDLVKAGAVLQVKVLDHIIIGSQGYFSFGDEGLLV